MAGDASSGTLCSLICPTRGRPQRFVEMVESALQTAQDPGCFELLAYVDNTDPHADAYREAARRLLERSVRLVLVVGEPIGVPRAYNHLVRLSTGRALMTVSDDNVFITGGWDRRLAEEIDRFPDQVYCLWFDDGVLGERQCSFPIISRAWFDTVGYFHSALFEHYYTDTWTHHLGMALGRARYVGDVLIEHRHWTIGRAERDETYLMHQQGFPGRRARDRETFERFQPYLQVDAALLLKRIQEHDGLPCAVRIQVVRTET